ncbi:hypothetical protein P3W75_02135 [Pseudomonas citronellolis]|nr:hypothetical protein [Pseudomonas citronellolis]MDF3931405.1 hypothetical protein [Pseudomonas citronellolis]
MDRAKVVVAALVVSFSPASVLPLERLWLWSSEWGQLAELTAFGAEPAGTVRLAGSLRSAVVVVVAVLQTSAVHRVVVAAVRRPGSVLPAASELQVRATTEVPPPLPALRILAVAVAARAHQAVNVSPQIPLQTIKGMLALAALGSSSRPFRRTALLAGSGVVVVVVATAPSRWMAAAPEAGGAVARVTAPAKTPLVFSLPPVRLV